MTEYWEQIVNYVAPSAKYRLICHLKLDNDERRLMDRPLLVLPEDATQKKPENYYDENMWNNAPLAGILRESGIRTRGAGHNLTGLVLLLRLRQVMEGTAPPRAFEPNWYGENKKEFYLPLLTDFLMTTFLVAGTVLGVHYLYGFCERYHTQLECHTWKEFYSLKCFVLKQSRHYLEMFNYELVFTTMCVVGLALVSIFRKHQSALYARFN